MAANIPTPEALIESFPAPALPRIEGEPSYPTLIEIKNLLRTNAASRRTTLGGGNNGYTGIILSPASYATVSAIAWVDPVNPGIHPVIAPGATAAAIAQADRDHKSETKEFEMHDAMQQALKKQLIAAIDPIYLRAIRDREVGFTNISIRTMLEHLMDNYGTIDPFELIDNYKKIQTPWDPNMPLERLINQIEECADLAEAGNQAFTAAQILNFAYTLVFNTGLFFDECKKWCEKSAAQQTWANFKTHFTQAHKQLRRQQHTTQQAGFHAANAILEAKLDENAFILANLANAATASREEMANLNHNMAEMNKKLLDKTNELKQLKESLANAKGTNNNNNSGGNNRNNNNNSGGYNRNNNNNNRNRFGRTYHPPMDQGSYCWSHGFLVHKEHNSCTCRTPKPGHKTEATRDNNMGGNQEGKPTTPNNANN